MWPPRVLHQFGVIPPIARERGFHGAYNKLLNFLFPPDSDFTVFPQYLHSQTTKSSDFLITVDDPVQGKPLPALIVELKKPSAIVNTSSRHAADQQMRQRMEDLTEYCPLPTLFRLSAFGTRMCFYYRNIGDGPAVIKPQCIPWNPDIVTDTAPKERWDYDILHPDGEEKLREIVNMIQEAYRSAK